MQYLLTTNEEMAALIAFFIIIIVSFIILRIARIVLIFTGISEDIAQFQALSVFTGTGFSTRESEIMVIHPVRRRVLMMLMWARNIGFVTAITFLVIYFLDTKTLWEFLLKAAYFTGGGFSLYILSRIKLFTTILSFLVKPFLNRWSKIPVHDYDSLLNLSSEFEVSTCLVANDSWVANKALMELQLPDEGILILGIRRIDGYYVGIPQGNTMIFPDDRLIMYGREDLLRNIGTRKVGDAGDLEHQEEVKHQLMIKGKKITPLEKGKGFFKRLFKGLKKQ